MCSWPPWATSSSSFILFDGVSCGWRERQGVWRRGRRRRSWWPLRFWLCSSLPSSRISLVFMLFLVSLLVTRVSATLTYSLRWLPRWIDHPSREWIRHLLGWKDWRSCHNSLPASGASEVLPLLCATTEQHVSPNYSISRCPVSKQIWVSSAMVLHGDTLSWSALSHLSPSSELAVPRLWHSASTGERQEPLGLLWVARGAWAFTQIAISLIGRWMAI